MPTTVPRDAFGNAPYYGSSSWTDADWARAYSNLGTIQNTSTFTSPNYANTITPEPVAANIGPGTASTNLAAAAQNTQLADLINAVNREAQIAANKSRLGPEGQQIQDYLMQNTMAGSMGVLDPTTEQMMRANIASRYGQAGMGIDSPALYSAYVRGMGSSIEEREDKALQNYLALLAANPSAPIFNMGELTVPSNVYGSAASADAARALEAQQFAATMAFKQQEANRAAQQAADELAYRYYAANLGAAGRGGAGGYGAVPSAAQANVRGPVDTGVGYGNQIYGALDPFYTSRTGAGTSRTSDFAWDWTPANQEESDYWDWFFYGEPETTTTGSYTAPQYTTIDPFFSDWGASDWYTTDYSTEPYPTTEGELWEEWWPLDSGE